MPRTGRGTRTYADGRKHSGVYKADLREGHGGCQLAGGTYAASTFRQDRYVGEGAMWSADRTRAWRLVDGGQREE